ncbi:MAG: sensor histidine kinase [Alistipes sp.]|jgi:sensor histidine kinase YesM|nr:sensor histidine kinase [Alistipes sp.]
MDIFTTNGSPAKRVLTWTALLVAYCIFLSVFYHFMRGDIFPYDSLGAGLKIYLLNLIPTSILTVANYLIIFKLLDRGVVARWLPLKMAADFVASIAMMYLFIWLFNLINQPFRQEPLEVDAGGVLLHDVLIVMSLEILYYIRRSREAVEKAEYAKQEALRYQYDSLKAQVDPHFLFNSLNILLALISIDTKKAGEFTISLSHIYRYVLSIQNKTSVPLSEELRFLASYVAILEMRYNRSFRVEVTGGGAADETRHIVPLTLQLLIENVFKHNVISSRHPMRVSVEVGGEGVSVSNPILPRKNSGHSNGIGLKYISEQYRICGKTFIFADDGRTFTATVPYL